MVNAEKSLTKKWEKVIDPVLSRRVSSGREFAYRIKARLLDPSEDKHAITRDGAKKAVKDLTDKLSPLLPTDYYVIVGRGPAAVVNHTTLRQSDAGRDRIDGRPVMHIGFRDPWGDYHEHGMGQPPFLLRMPGYHAPAPLNARTIRTGLSSRVFAKSTDDELTLLKQKFETYIVEGWVAAIESVGTPVGNPAKDALVTAGVHRGTLNAILAEAFPNTYPTYRLLVVRGPKLLYFVYASHIDICAGGGRGRILPREFNNVTPDSFAGATLPPWKASYHWSPEDKQRKIINGLDGLTEATEWKTGQRVCVYGSGGIGLNQIERAHDEIESGKKIYLDWFARQWLHDPTLNLRRNDTVFQDPEKVEGDDGYPFMDAGGLDAARVNPAPPNAFDTTIRILPGSPYWRWAHYAKIKVPTIEDGKIVIDMYPQNAPGVAEHAQTPTSVDFWLQELPLSGDPHDHFHFSDDYEEEHDDAACVTDSDDGRAFDRLILCLGQDQQLLGEPRKITTGFVLQPKVLANRLVALETVNGNIRVLGASAVMFPGFGAGNAAWDQMNTWRGTLPASAVLPGFIAAGANIAYANGFFTDDRPNRNVNTAPRDDLVGLLTGAGIAANVANLVCDRIEELRKWRNDGIAALEVIRDVIESTAALLGMAIGLSPADQNDQDALEILAEALASWDNITAQLSTDYPDPEDF
ncbi:MAG TPA: hypothetical protein VGQ65_06460 [Thermoanaerobaculia bacterium]|nr:hypothetical protein [Thermoanaerobaculia bacterium]